MWRSGNIQGNKKRIEGKAAHVRMGIQVSGNDLSNLRYIHSILILKVFLSRFVIPFKNQDNHILDDVPLGMKLGFTTTMGSKGILGVRGPTNSCANFSWENFS